MFVVCLVLNLILVLMMVDYLKKVSEPAGKIGLGGDLGFSLRIMGKHAAYYPKSALRNLWVLSIVLAVGSLFV